MILGKIVSRTTVLVSCIFVTACGDFLGHSGNDGAFDWENGETLAPADDQNLEEEQRIDYRRDAEKLAVRFVNESDSTETEVPEALIELFYNGLVHIANSEHQDAQEATIEYPVHARTPTSSRKVLVFTDTAASWIKAWRKGDTKTGDAAVDSLVDRFNMTLIEYRELEHVLSTSIATLQSDRAINVYAVGRLFEELEDIEYAGPDGITDGSDIRVLFFDNHLRFRFEYGFGDCPAGCISRHYWYFHVYKDGRVEFAGEKGPLPSD